MLTWEVSPPHPLPLVGAEKWRRRGGQETRGPQCLLMQWILAHPLMPAWPVLSHCRHHWLPQADAAAGCLSSCPPVQVTALAPVTHPVTHALAL
jgi:hypothetical protein